MTTKEKTHWIANESGRKVFWANAAELGLDHDAAHKFFKVSSMYEYTGTLQDAITAMRVRAAAKEDTRNDEPADPDEAFGPLDDEYAGIDSEQPDPTDQDDVDEPLPGDEPQKVEDPAPTQDPEPAPVNAEQDLLTFQASQTLPEAPVIVWTNFVDTQGYTWSFTVRAGLPAEQQDQAMRNAIRGIGQFKKAAKQFGWLPEGRGGYVPMPADAFKSPDAAAPPAPFGGNGGQGQERPKSGVDPLKKLTVTPEGKVQFHVGKFRYPFGDNRGAETVAQLFDEDLGITPAHLVPGALYENFTGIMVQWEKPEKYYDVLRVYRAE